jgi:hypothetical protein
MDTIVAKLHGWPQECRDTRNVLYGNPKASRLLHEPDVRRAKTRSQLDIGACYFEDSEIACAQAGAIVQEPKDHLLRLGIL